MINEIESTEEIIPGNHISIGLSPATIVQVFDFKDSELRDKKIIDIGGGFNPLSCFLKNRYEVGSATVLDPIVEDMTAKEYHFFMDKGIDSIKSRRKKLSDAIATQKRKDAIYDNLHGIKAETPAGSMDCELKDMSNIIDDYYAYSLDGDVMLNSSSVLNIEGVEEGSQDMAFMCYVIRHFDDQKKLQILENIYKILKEDGALYDVGHIKHANVRKELGLEPEYKGAAYYIAIPKEQLGELIQNVKEKLGFGKAA